MSIRRKQVLDWYELLPASHKDRLHHFPGMSFEQQQNRYWYENLDDSTQNNIFNRCLIHVKDDLGINMGLSCVDW
jgi:hypothetical protein